MGALPVVFTVLLACGERAPADTSDAPSTPPSRPSIVADGAIGSLALPDAGQEATTLELGTIGNKMSYTAEVLEAPAGLIRVRFTNHADLGALQHNVVIVRWGDREAIGRAALTAGEAKQFVPADVRAGGDEATRSGRDGHIAREAGSGGVRVLLLVPRSLPDDEGHADGALTDVTEARRSNGHPADARSISSASNVSASPAAEVK